MGHDLRLSGLVLAAGEGTRLWPLTRHRPKPLVPLAGRPLLAWGLDALRAAGVGAVGVNAFHLAEQVVAACAHDPHIAVIVEEALLGTGGGIRGISARLPEGTVIALNGDALFDFALAPFLAYHRAVGALGTLVLREVPPDAPFGRVGVDAGGRVHRIAEVEGPDAHRHALRFGAFTGVQLLEPDLLAAIPAGPCDILRSAWKARLNERAPLYGVFAAPDCAWFDVGTPERYLAAHRAVLAGWLPAPHLPPPDATGRRIHPDAQVHPTAHLVGPCAVLAGARIEAGARVGPHALVDVGAVVMAGAEVVDTVLWPATRASGRVHHAIVLPDEVVGVESEAPDGAS